MTGLSGGEGHEAGRFGITTIALVTILDMTVKMYSDAC